MESLRERLKSLTPQQRIDLIEQLSPEQVQTLLYDWDFMARPEQREPTDSWLIWFIRTGRGWGKTMTGAQTVRKYVEKRHAKHIALVGPTAADARDVMVGLDPDSSGLLQICPPWNKPTYEPSKRRVVWPNGTVGTLYSGEEPERLRGPQHDMAWCDEPAAWQYIDETWDNLMFGLRRGESKCIITGTPTPHPWVIARTKDPDVILTRGSTYDNPFLSKVALERLEKRYEGTRLGRQELHGDILDDVPGALWTYSMFEKNRIRSLDDVPSLSRIVVPLDVAVTSKNKSAQTGIVVCGVGKCYCSSTNGLPENHGFVLGDYSSRMSPNEVLRVALQAFSIHRADRIIGEINNGGDWIEALLRTHDEHVPYTGVHATRGKVVRAEPISALYEQGKIHHVGDLTKLEDQMVTFVSGDTAGLKDRVDSTVWGFTELYRLLTGVMGDSTTVPSLKIDKPILADLKYNRTW
jgi:phage terminase large subunit-like protein